MGNARRRASEAPAAVFIALGVLALIAAQQPGEGQFLLNPPAPEPLCDCSADLYDCSDFATQFQAQQCFDSCWVVTGDDVHRLDADWDYVACEHLPWDRLPMDRKVVHWVRPRSGKSEGEVDG